MRDFKSSFSFSFVIILAIFAGIIFGMFYKNTIVIGSNSRATGYGKLLYTMELLEQKYVNEINRDSISELLVPELLQKLDPHSEYIPVQQAVVSNEQLTGHFEGIGVMFNTLTDTLIISNIIDNGPSYKAGMLAGDRIITVNDTVIAGKNMLDTDIIKLLKGKKGSTVKLGIERDRKPELLEVDVIRDVIPVHSADASFMIEPTIGYINISRFAATTHQEFLNAVERLKGEGLESLIIDLRRNGGGYLNQTIYLANEFLPKGAGILYTEGRTEKRKEIRADGEGQYKDLPLVILMSSESASSSEIFAGAMQDNDRATVVGLRSFGKGLIQEQIDYPDGSAARITIAHYYTPLGRSIQKPYNNMNREEYQMEVYRRFEHDELTNEDSTKIDRSQEFITPKGRVLYGGGGIHPDVFVPIDTTKTEPYFRSLIQKSLIFKYSNLYTENHRKELNKVKTFADFDKLLSKTNLLADFVQWAKKQGVKAKGDELQKSKKYILSQLKSYIGRNTELADNADHYYSFPIDNTLKKGVEELKK